MCKLYNNFFCKFPEKSINIGVWRSLCLAGVWSQAVGFVLVRCRKDVFTFYVADKEVLQMLYFQCDLQI
jgi:hypothetical protein